MLLEIKQRMARKQSAPLKIQTARRYGRIIRQPDGSVVRIERTQIRVQRRDGPAFGAGFESRIGQRPNRSFADGIPNAPVNSRPPQPLVERMGPPAVLVNGAAPEER